MCFKLRYSLSYETPIALYRYRGKYDHPTNIVSEAKPFELSVYILGSDRKLVLEFFSSPGNAFSIGKSKMLSESMYSLNISRFADVSSFTINGYIHMHLFFNNK